MIIDRYIIKEITTTFIGVTFVLMLIFLSALLLRLFDDAARGMFQVNVILVLMGLKSIGNLAFILPLSMYLSILLALSRLYKDNEMAALSASGIGELKILRSVIMMSVVFALFVGYLTLIIAPWAKHQSDVIIAKSKVSSEVTGINPGRFRDLAAGQGTLYVQDVNDNKTRLKNVFVQVRDPEGDIIVTAESGYKFTDKVTGDDFIELENGYRYQGNPGDLDYSIVHFKKHGLRIRQKAPTNVYNHKLGITTKKLYSSPDLSDKIELHSRISFILLCLVLSILAVPLSRTSPRQGQYAKLTIAILIYITYANLLNINRAWLEKGKIPIEASFWWLHLLMFSIALIFIFKQSGIRYIFYKRVKA
ncbi:MAG: LPS export ABC transporter permease LptF [Gammaproteobacteria bacterium]